MNALEEAGARLKLWRKSKRLTQDKLASALGYTQGLIGQIERGSTGLSREFLTKLSVTYGLSADWLLTGLGDMSQSGLDQFVARIGTALPPDLEAPAHGDLRFDGMEFSYVRRMELSVSAGSGVVALDDGVAWGMSLPTSWFSRNQVNADLVVMVRVRGDSMAPTIPDGANILVHLAEKTPERPGIFAFTLHGECFVKRLVPSDTDPDGRPTSVVIVADNRAYPPVVLSGQALEQLRIVGRVRAAFLEF